MIIERTGKNQETTAHCKPNTSAHVDKDSSHHPIYRKKSLRDHIMVTQLVLFSSVVFETEKDDQITQKPQQI